MTARAIVGLAALSLVFAGCGDSERVVVAAGTTAVDSGLMEIVAQDFERQHPGVNLSVVGESTANILELGRRGEADVLITHAPEAERAFLLREDVSRYESVFSSRFILVGPPSSGLGGDAIEVMQALGGGAVTFVTRADGSGTHSAELALWEAAGVVPTGQPWYLETGQGMGLTLQVTDQRSAFTLSELGSFLAARPVLSLVAVVDDPAEALLGNPYHATVPSEVGSRAAAELFVDWLVSDDGRQAIIAANRQLFGDAEVYRVP